MIVIKVNMSNNKDADSYLKKSRDNSRNNKAKNISNREDKQSQSKTIKSSRKRSFNLPKQEHNFKNSNPLQRLDKRHSQISEPKGLVCNPKVIEEDKKTKHLKDKLKTQNQQLQQQLSLHQRLRDAEPRKSGENSIDKNEQKIKITSRFRKLVLQRQGIMKIIQGSIVDPSQLRRQQKEYEEIANDIQLNNMQSKVVQIPHSHKPPQNLLHNMKESQSLMVASPLTDKKQSGLKFSLAKSPEKEQQFAISIENSHIKMGGGSQTLKNQTEIYEIECIDEEDLINSVKKIQEEDLAQNINFSSSRQVQINIKEMHQIQPQSIVKIQQSQALTVEKGQTSRAQELRKSHKRKNLQLQWNIVNQVIPGKSTIALENHQGLEEELINLRKTVRQLRLEKVKALASKQLLQERQKSSLNEKQSIRPRKISSDHYETIINALSIDSQSHRALTTQKSDNLPINFGRIRKNRSSKKVNLSLQSPNPTKRPLINISKLSTTTNKRIPQNNRQRSRINSYNRSKQYKTLNLTKIVEENMEESNFTNLHHPLAKTTDYTRDLDIQKSIEMRAKLMEKFQADDKKFQKFLIREQSKSRSRVRRYQPDRPETSKGNMDGQPQVDQFQGTIVKNIIRPFYQSDQFRLSHCWQAQFLPKHIISLIQKCEARTIKRNPAIPKIDLPIIPQHPNPNTPTQQIMELILKILPYSDETYNQNELQGCSLKKYKNCLMFELPNNNAFRIVWHYTGKLYIGEWNSDKNQKEGEGIEYMPKKYYYKGQYIAGKRYGKGLFIHNNSIYQGQFVNGLKEGKGKFYDNLENNYYQGQWKNNKVQGRGYSECEGNFYQGSFKEGLKVGFGIQQFANGDKYYGQYREDKFQGFGKYVWADGAYYIGSFKDGYRHDYGKWVSGEDNPQIYTGFYTKDKKQGTGRYVWSNGCVYDGHFENDFKHGIGSIQYPDGNYMEGVWAQGILTNVISKLSEANLEAPLDEPKSREYQSHTRIRIVEV